MDDDDRGFFILVLGVLAAIVMLVSWWYTNAGSRAASQFATSAGDRATHGAPDRQDAATEDSASPPDAAPDEAATDADADGAEAEAAQPAAAQPATVFDALAEDESLSVLTNLLRGQGLDVLLAGAGPFTLFAPSNDAISEAAGSEATLALLDAESASVLGYHVVPGTFGPDELVEFVRGSRQAELDTVQGEPLGVAIDGGRITLNGTSSLDAIARTTGNGVLYVIDTVLIPPVASLNALVSIEPILFAIGSAEIDPASFATLDQLVQVLESTTTGIVIEGHTDDEGDELLNQDLSANRARAVLNYLVANGIDDTRLTAVGLGSTRPRADNATEQGRAQNRRIEFTLG